MVKYGVLKGRVVGFHRAEVIQEQVRNGPGPGSYTSNHFHLVVEADGQQWRCPVNVKSQDGSEVWFKIRDAFVDHPILAALPGLPTGLTELPQRIAGRTLDYVREPLFDRTTMRHLPKDGAGANDDVQDHLQLYAEQARSQPDAQAYVFGSFWRNQLFPPDRVIGTDDGVHDIHMNQGNDPGHTADDGIWQDGGVILHFPSSGRHVGIFLCFDSQVWATNDQGHRLQGHAEGPLAGTLQPLPPDEPAPVPGPVAPETSARLRVIAALLNPEGADPGLEKVTLFNYEMHDVSLNGWKLLDRHDKLEALDGLTVPSCTSLTITLGGLGAQLGNNGGSIRLVDANGTLVHSVTYTQDMAVSGRIAELM